MRLAILDDAGDVSGMLDTSHERTPAATDAIVVAPLGDTRAIFCFLSAPHLLVDGDVFLIGGQLLRFRMLGTTPASTAQGDGVHGSVLPGDDVAVLEQLVEGDRVRDRYHLATRRRVLLGRDEGDVVFPWDRLVSARHAELRWRADQDTFELCDLGSRNGTGVAIRSTRQVRAGERLLIAGQMLRVERA